MNIYQKLKESGYNTDGLASPLKIDPPKKTAKKGKFEEIPSRRDSAVVGRAYQVEREDSYGDSYAGRKFAKERKSDPYAYPKSEYKSTSKKWPKLDKYMSTFDNRSAFIEKHGGTKLSPKPQYDRPAGPRKRPTKKYYDGSKTYPRESKDLYTGPTKVDAITTGLRTSKTDSIKDIKRIKKSKSPLKAISPACKTAAKKKFDVWPSAYASGWGVRCTKAGGPGKMGGKKS
jgi:hypothetical protein